MKKCTGSYPSSGFISGSEPGIYIQGRLSLESWSQARAMKVMLVITSVGVGGAERLVTALADRFANAGHEVILVRFHGEVELYPRDSRVELVNLEMRRNPMGVLKAMGRLRKLIDQFRPDVVNSHLVHANILTRLLRLFTVFRTSVG